MKLEPKQVFMLEVGEFDNLVQKTYGRIYDFQQQDGCKDRGIFQFTLPIESPSDFENETIPEKVNGNEMGVSFAAWLARDPKQKLNAKDEWDREHGLDLFWRRNFYPDVEIVVADLNKRGLLPAGDYIINIDW